MTVSICVPAYNAAATLAITLDSLVMQTYRDLDIIVVDNASTDATPQIVARYASKDMRVRHLRFEDHVHGHDNFTRCFLAARGDLMAIFHADDVYHPRIVEEEVALLRARPDIGLVFTRAGRIDDEGKYLNSPFPIPQRIFSNGLAEFNFTETLRAVLQFGHIFMTPSGMGRTEVYRSEIGHWPRAKFGGSADLFVFLSIAQNHKLAILDQSLMDYRVGRISESFRYARRRRIRHDIFLTLDYWIAHAKESTLRPQDHENYEFLLLKDDINLATSHLIDGDRSMARQLMPRLISSTVIKSASRYKRHVVILISGLLVWALSFVPLGARGREMLRKRRFG